MSVNDTMNINQVSTVLNAIQKAATGRDSNIQAVDYSSFVSVAQSVLKTGYDTTIGAISQVLSRTVFSARPYTAKFSGIEMDAPRFGNHVRKLQVVDQDAVDDERFGLTDGTAVDMFKVKKPKVVQTNFYSQSVYENYYTMFRDQLDVAFSSPQEFQQFISMVVSNRADKWQQWKEDLARGVVTNAILATISKGKTEQKIQLVTEWNARCGYQTAKTWVQIQADPDEYAAFVKWACGRIKTVASLMTNRSAAFHSKVFDGTSAVDIMRHTPYNRMKCYMLTSEINQIESNVFSSIFQPEFLELIDHEEVDFWQDINHPYNVSGKASYMDSADGVAKQTGSTTGVVLGVLFDEDALGFSVVNEWSNPTPFNPAGGYWNEYDHANVKTFFDPSESLCVFLLS